MGRLRLSTSHAPLPGLVPSSCCQASSWCKRRPRAIAPLTSNARNRARRRIPLRCAADRRDRAGVAVDRSFPSAVAAPALVQSWLAPHDCQGRSEAGPLSPVAIWSTQAADARGRVGHARRVGSTITLPMGLARVWPMRRPEAVPSDSGSQRRARTAQPYRRDARVQHDASGHRRDAKRGENRHHPRWVSVAALERPSCPRPPAPAQSRAPRTSRRLTPQINSTGPLRSRRKPGSTDQVAA
jgi:hypothetical protein